MHTGDTKKKVNEYEGAHDSDEDLYDLIDRLEVSVDQARSLPFSDNCIVDREEMLILIGMVREHLPNEIRQAKLLLDQNRHIIAEARKEAESIMREAEMRMTAMIDEHEITRKAKLERDQILENANTSAQNIRKKSMDYAKKKLTDLEEELTEMLVTVQRNKKELK
ncbi:ATPase [Candidatus Nomurabacteria bacterium]|nr:ATPase [Candidatus Nomurabacteria bacterium]